MACGDDAMSFVIQLRSNCKQSALAGRTGTSELHVSGRDVAVADSFLRTYSFKSLKINKAF